MVWWVCAWSGVAWVYGSELGVVWVVVWCGCMGVSWVWCGLWDGMCEDGLAAE